jgi:CBS domain-containing protein
VTTAREIMTEGAECASSEETVQDAAEKMARLGVGALPICGTDERLKGMITDRDIVIKVLAAHKNPARTKVGELAQGTPVTIGANDATKKIIETMTEHQIRRLPVIENKRLVGMISEADLARHLDEHRLAEFVEKVYAMS